MLDCCADHAKNGLPNIADILAKHKDWLAGESTGQRADLRSADLRGADLDFSSWPLWCGSKNVQVDDKLFSQLLNHIMALNHPAAIKMRKSAIAKKYHEIHKESAGLYDEAVG